jgi:UDP:flavonoid glycosyltransferase YjiC (YdhE family)
MKIGFISFAIPGHFNPMSALARQLQSRNHDVVMLSEKNGISVAADLLEQTFGLTKSTETSVQKTAYPENSLPVQSSTSTQTNCSKKCAIIIITRARRLSDQSARELRQ